MSKMTENILEETCLYWLEELGWNISPIGTTLTPNPSPRGRGEYALDKEHTGLAQFERNSYSEVILVNRLRESLAAINPDVPAVGIDEAVRKILTTGSPDLLTNNRNFHRMLTDGIAVEVPRDESSSPTGRSGDEGFVYGGTIHKMVWLVDIEKIENNDWLALNQLTVIEKSVAGQAEVNRRADVVLYLNGLPIALLELKNPGDENATIKHAFNQLQTYKKDIPSLFTTNELLVISDGILARAGTLTSGWDRYMPWRTVSGEEVAPKGTPELETLVRGLFERRYFLDYILNFVVFEDDGSKLIKKAAAYHQYWAVNKALGCTLSACGIDGDPTKLIGRFPSEQESMEVREDSPAYGKGTKHFDGKRIGVVWHTQGSGKSLSMTFYAGKVVRHPDMGNPTLVIITDRNDLDDQLFGTFANCKDLLRQSPVQAGNRSHLRKLLKVASGGIVFTTIQKFMPPSLPTGELEAPSSLAPLPKGEGDKNSLSDGRNGNEGCGSHYRGGYDFSGLVKRARELREKQTPSEDVFWQLVRNRKLEGLKFRRQHQVGDYIVDFYCHELRLIVELDGLVHQKTRGKDQKRDQQLNALGNTVLRFTNEEFESKPATVFERILECLPSTSGRGAGGEGRQRRQMDILSDRKNIVVIADEAHRSQYDFIDGFARHLHDALPNASFIGFTGTPIESDDRSTPAVFGDYIDKYDILRAVEDGATVPIYYESRLARIELSETRLSEIDPEFEQITEAEEETGKQKLKTKWAALEAMVGADDRIKLVVRDLVAHFEKRLDTMDGKAMIVCMSRRICVDIYNALKEIRPDWHSDDDSEGFMKIVMSGSASDHIDWQPHIRNKAGREDLAKRFKDPSNGLKLVIVRDMWLTGFDCPSMHTMYVDKPMSGHNLMQAIARVNRVFRDKPGGLVVDYIGLADSLKKALANYTASGGRGDATIDQEQAATVLMEKYEVVRDMMHGFRFSWETVSHPHPQPLSQRAMGENTKKISLPVGEAEVRVNCRLSAITQAMEFILGQDDGKKRYLPAVSALTKAFALAVPHEKAIQIRDEVGFFQEVRAALVKTTGDEQGRTPDEIDSAIKQLVSKAVASTEVVDIFEAAGMDKPDISILSDEFLEEVKALPQKNLALELLKKLINDEIKTRSKKNVIQARSFAKMLELAVKKYQNRAIEAAEIIQELIELARELRKSEQRGDSLGLTEDEVAFYDALADNGSAKDMLGDEKLRTIAQLLVDRVKRSVSIDWTLRENARAQIRVLVKRILRKFGYPPDMAKRATELVLEQTEALCREWTL